MFIFIEKDSFGKKGEANASSGAAARASRDPLKRGSLAAVRRPYRGIQIKDDTYATLSVRTATGEAIPLTSSSATQFIDDGIGKVNEYSDFILQRVEDTRMEKNQIIETFGDSFVYFFGEKPRIVTISGMLINTEDFNWRSQFWANYEEFFRGSKLVERNARVYLGYDTLVMEGYPLTASAVDDSTNPYGIPFSMSLLMTNFFDHSTIGSVRFPGATDMNAGNLQVLNQELDLRRAKFISTSAMVRKFNLEAKGPTGILATFRQGIRAFNDVTATVSGFLDIANRTLAGRSLRIPIGAAGFLLQAGIPTVAQSSILTSSKVEFDAKTGKLITLFGPLKLQLPGPPRFAHVNILRGNIYENKDEYPLRKQPALTELLNPLQEAQRLFRVEERFLLTGRFDVAVVALDAQRKTGGIIGTIAEGVAFARSSFGMLMTAGSFLADPLAVVTDALGITPGDLLTIGNGILRRVIPGGIFIGSAAGRTFKNLGERISRNVQEAFSKPGFTEDIEDQSSLGEVYDSNDYDVTTRPVIKALTEEEQRELSGTLRAPDPSRDPEDKDYEAAYGDRDYTALVTTKFVEEDADVESSTERQNELTLDEVYGNTDASEASSDIEPLSLDEVYGTGSSGGGDSAVAGGGTIKSTARSPEEIAEILARLQSGQEQSNDEDVEGIIGVDDTDSDIPPVV